MNKPSERIVVFVSPAQKRAIAATAEELGISVSELMRRAVLNFGATSEQVKAASIVDWLRAPREPDALNAALQRVAGSAKADREALPPALRSVSSTAQTTSEKISDGALNTHRGSVPQPQALAAPASIAPVPTPAPLTPLQALAAMAAEAADVDTHVDEALRAAEAQAAAEAAARVAAAKAATLKAAKSPSKSKRAAGTSSRDDSPFIDPTEGTGRFA
ncbi:plasmid mobilization protein [Paraburkholderia sp. 2C]